MTYSRADLTAKLLGLLSIMTCFFLTLVLRPPGGGLNKIDLPSEAFFTEPVRVVFYNEPRPPWHPVLVAPRYMENLLQTLNLASAGDLKSARKGVKSLLSLRLSEVWSLCRVSDFIFVGLFRPRFLPRGPAPRPKFVPAETAEKAEAVGRLDYHTRLLLWSREVRCDATIAVEKVLKGRFRLSSVKITYLFEASSVSRMLPWLARKVFKVCVFGYKDRFLCVLFHDIRSLEGFLSQVKNYINE